VYLDQPTAYERGLACGRAMSAEIAALMPRFVASFPWSAERMDEVWALQENYVPAEMKEMMRGLAEGSGVGLEVLRRAHVIPELAEFSCSGFAAWGSATEDGRLYSIRVLDWEMGSGCQDYPVICVTKPERGNLWVNVGWAGFVGSVTGFNEKQVSVGEMTAGNVFPERLEGTPMPFLMAEVLRKASTLEEAVEGFRSARRTSSFFYVIGDAKIPEGMMLLTGYDGFLEVRENDAKYALLGLPGIKDVVYGSYRNELCARMLQENRGRINVQVAKAVARAVASDEGALHIAVFDPGALKMWVANAEGVESAQHREFVEFDLKAFLAEARGSRQ